MLGVDDRLLGADDRVDVLEEHDPGRDLVRPGDDLRLLLVLAEVAGGVEELLGDDRRAQANVGECDALAGCRAVADSTPRSNSARMSGTSSSVDLVAVEHAGARGALGRLEGDELHVATPQMSAATSA